MKIVKALKNAFDVCRIQEEMNLMRDTYRGALRDAEDDLERARVCATQLHALLLLKRDLMITGTTTMSEVMMIDGVLEKSRITLQSLKPAREMLDEG